MADETMPRPATAPGGSEGHTGSENVQESAGSSGSSQRASGGEKGSDSAATDHSQDGSNGEKTKQDAQGSSESSGPPEQAGQKKPSKVKHLWDKAGLDVMTLMMMFKGSLPPIIALAMYESDAVAAQYQTLGYLVAIASILGFCIMPRGKFIQTMSLNVLAILLGAAVNILALYSVVRARQNTTPPGPAAGRATYNSSASAVCAVWLFAQTYLVNTLRAARPQYQFPCIIYSIFINVSLTYGVMFPTMASVLSFMERLIEAFLTGFALATATHFIVFPTSSRKVVFKQMAGYIQLLNGLVKTQTGYMGSLQTVNPINLRKKNEKEADANAKKPKRKQEELPDSLYANPAAKKMKELLDKLTQLHTKLHGDITPAKREIAIGKLESHDITELWGLLRLIFVPVMGLSSIMTIFEREAEKQGWGRDDLSGDEEAERVRMLDNVHFLMKTLQKPFQQMTGNLDGAFNHILLTLEFTKPPKKAKDTDVESKAGSDPAPPGSPGFAAAYKHRLDAFANSKSHTLQQWCAEHDIALPADFFTPTPTSPNNPTAENLDAHIPTRDQRNLFLTLYLEYLLHRTGRAVLALVLFVDKRRAAGAFAHTKVIFPGSKTLYDWFRSSVWGREDVSQESSYTADLDSGISQSSSAYLGQAFEKRRDPEHERPRNARERLGERVRQIPIFFRSDASAFGFRAACATMSLAIVCYLHPTQTFFLQNRLLWAMIMVAISMTRTAGQSIFNFVLRIGGTAVAMLGSYVIWYVVVGRVAGVLVLLWAWIFCAFYVVLKMPKLLVVGILSLVTCVLTVGYELQVKKIGEEAVESNGQPAYPMYILAPYRLATVTAGIFVAFLWTLFPYPVSESTELRKDLGAAMYLMGLYYHLGHETLKSAIRDQHGDAEVLGTHANHLEAARRTVFSKLIFLLEQLGTNSAFSRYQIPVGGRFPREEYESLINTLKRLLLWISLANYTSATFEDGSARSADRTQWSRDFRHLLTTTAPSTHRITTLLSVLSSSLRAAAPLPPHLDLPEPFAFAQKLEALDADILSARHLVEPEYAAFAVMQVVSRNIVGDVGELARHTKNLVGEIDFSFRAIEPSEVDEDVGSLGSSAEESLKKD